MTDSVTATAIAHSPALWRTWFDEGLRAIDQGAYRDAVSWLQEAMRHIPDSSGADRRCAMTQANLAFVLMRWSQRYCERILPSEDQYWVPIPECRACISPIPPPDGWNGIGDDALLTPAAARERAQMLMKWAVAEASKAWQHFQSGSGNGTSQTVLAIARTEHVLGESCRRTGESSDAGRWFSQALKNYRTFPLQESAVDELLCRLFEFSYCQCRFDKALARLDDLERRIAPRPGSVRWVAKLVACRADVHLQQADYREAAELYQRWAALDRKEAPGPGDRRDIAYACALFGRALTIVGRLNESESLLDRGLPLAEQLKPRDLTVWFDLRLALGELHLVRGRLDIAHTHLEQLAELKPADPGRQVRLSTTRGRLHLALGQFVVSRSCFEEGRRTALASCGNRPLLLVPPTLGLARLDSLRSHWMRGVERSRQMVRHVEAQENQVRAEMGSSRHELAYAFLHDDKGNESGPLCETARQLLAVALGPTAPELADLQMTIAGIFWSRGELALAHDACANALERLRAQGGLDLFAIARVWSLQGQLLHSAGELRRAEYFFDCAHTTWVDRELSLRLEHPEKSLLLLGIATLAAAQGGPSAAEETFQELLPLLIQLKGTRARVGYELNRRANIFLRLRRFPEAIWLYEKARDLYSEELGAKHPYATRILDNLRQAQQRMAASERPAEPASPLSCDWSAEPLLRAPEIEHRPFPTVIDEAQPVEAPRTGVPPAEMVVPVPEAEKDLPPPAKVEETLPSPVDGPVIPILPRQRSVP
jgi:tetratricopeptide (TPR) repeat protein